MLISVLTTRATTIFATGWLLVLCGFVCAGNPCRNYLCNWMAARALWLCLRRQAKAQSALQEENAMLARKLADQDKAMVQLKNMVRG